MVKLSRELDTDDDLYWKLIDLIMYILHINAINGMD